MIFWQFRSRFRTASLGGRRRSLIAIRVLTIVGLACGVVMQASHANAQAGTWKQVTTNNPFGSNGTMMLLTDGTVMVSQAAGFASKAWSKLTPDATGNYVNGTWSTLAPMSLERLYTASNVLPSGKVLVIGGEYSGPATTQNLTNTGEIYDPATNFWSPIPNFPNASFGDDPTVLLPDGTVLAGYIFGAQTYIYHPSTNSWSATANSKLRGDRSDEETWILLPDGSVLSYDVFSSLSGPPAFAQRYIPATQTWVDAGSVPVVLSTGTQGDELGPATLLPDGRVFQVGANENTALYTPSTNSWVQGPTNLGGGVTSLPAGMGADDAPGAMLRDGTFLFAADFYLFNSPTKIYKYDYTSGPVGTLTDVTPAAPASLATALASAPAFICRMLVLPNGHLLLSVGDNQLWDYTPFAVPAAGASWRPTITSTVKIAGKKYQLTGTQLTGISEGSSYGDDSENSTNYPIVSLTKGGQVKYATTANWTPSVSNPGNAAAMTVEFTLPNGLAAGNYVLNVIANGIPDKPASPYIFTVPVAGPNYIAYSYDSVKKTLTLTGDAEDNSLQITQSSNTITLQTGGLTKLGVSPSTLTTYSFHYGSDLKINGTFKDGNDYITINRLKSTSVVLDMGAGNDNVKFVYCDLSGSVDGGTGTDTVGNTGSYLGIGTNNVEVTLPP